MLVVGVKLYGKSDQVPGLFYVATHFFHVAFCPLIPVLSYLIVEGNERGEKFQGQRIGLSFKSVFFGWLRAWLLISSGVILLWAMDLADNALGGRPGGETAIVLGIFVIIQLGAFGYSYLLSRAGPKRALKLATRVGIPPEVLAPYFVHYDFGTTPDDESRTAAEDVVELPASREDTHG